MINLYDGKITDLIANEIRQDPEVQAIAYAVLQEKRCIIDRAKQTRTLALIDELPEEILDILAVELRTPFYSEDFSIESKRELIKGTLIYYTYMGTPKAVNTMLSAVFPGSYIEEWQDYGGTPYHFQIVLEMARYRDNANAGEIIRAVQKVQRLSAHLDGLVYQCETGIVIGTKGRGYAYHSTWCGRHEAGTVPWRFTRGGTGRAKLEAGTIASGFRYTFPEAGTAPRRWTGGGLERTGTGIVADGESWPYSAPLAGRTAAGTYPDRGISGGVKSGAFHADADGEAYRYRVKRCGISRQKL